MSAQGYSRFVFPLLLAVVAGVVMLLDSYAIRAGAFRNSKNCYYQLAQPLPRPTDVIIIGSSRMRRGIDPNLLASLLGVSKHHVVNLGHPGYHYDFDYALIESLLPRWRFSLIIAEANFDLTPKQVYSSGGIGYSPDFVHFASYHQIVASVSLASDRPLVLRAYDDIQLISLKIETALRFVLTGHLQEVLSPTGEAGKMLRPNVCWSEGFDREVPRRAAEKVRQQKQALKEKFFDEHDDWFEEGYSDPTLFQDKPGWNQRNYLKRTVRLAHENDVLIAFVNLPLYFAWPPGPAFVKQFRTAIGAPLFVPSKELLYTFHAGGYHDRAHLLPPARAAFTLWLAQELSAEGLRPRR
jgi:hypothetical protein